MVLADTSVWIDYLRGAPTEQARALRDLLSGEEACRRAGKTPRSSNDCLIARIAIEHRLVLLHNDGDFDVIASIIPELKLLS